MDSRLERAARALLGCNSRAPIGPDESSEWVAVSAEHLDNLRAALAAPEPAQAGEAVAFVPWRVDPQPDVFDDASEFEWCVETDEARPVLVCTVPSGVMRPQSAPGASHASFATANQIVADHNAMRGRPLPRAEAASEADAVREACASVDPRLNLKHPDKSYVEGGVDAVAAMRAAIRSLPLPAPASAEAVAREAARYATDDTARILSFGGVPRIEDIAAAKTGIVDRAVAHALRAKGAR